MNGAFCEIDTKKTPFVKRLNRCCCKGVPLRNGNDTLIIGKRAFYKRVEVVSARTWQRNDCCRGSRKYEVRITQNRETVHYLSPFPRIVVEKGHRNKARSDASANGGEDLAAAVVCPVDYCSLSSSPRIREVLCDSISERIDQNDGQDKTQTKRHESGTQRQIAEHEKKYHRRVNNRAYLADSPEFIHGSQSPSGIQTQPPGCHQPDWNEQKHPAVNRERCAGNPPEQSPDNAGEQQGKDITQNKIQAIGNSSRLSGNWGSVIPATPVSTNTLLHREVRYIQGFYAALLV